MLVILVLAGAIWMPFWGEHWTILRHHWDDVEVSNKLSYAPAQFHLPAHLSIFPVGYLGHVRTIQCFSKLSWGPHGALLWHFGS